VKRLLVTYLKPYWKLILPGVVLILLQAIAALYLPTLNAKIINNGVARGDTHYIAVMGGYMLLVAALQTVCAVSSAYLGAKAAMGFGRDVRGALFRKVESFSQNEVNRFGAPSLITRSTNDVQQVQMMATMGLTMLIFAPMMGIGGIIMALRQDLRLSWTLGVVVPLIAVMLWLVIRTAVPLFRSMQKKIDRMNQIMREMLSGVRVIRAFARSDYEERRFEASNRDLTDVGLKVMRLFAVVFPSLFLIMNLATVGIMWFGAERVDNGGMQIGNLLAFIMYVMQVLISVLMATMMASFIPRASASGARIQEVLEIEPLIGDPESPAPSATGEGTRKGRIEFKNVEFRYPGAEAAILSKISFAALPGQTTAIVGSTGSGKSTLISLVPRLYDVTSGSIELDGRDIRELARAELWKHIGFVPQKAFLFSGTVASNLRYGDQEASDEELWHALSVAQAKDFVEAMPEGLNEPIAQGGANVSGGQRQRLAIARALVKRPDVYVFDDSFSALDFKTDSLLRAALKREAADSTVLVVAQRVSSIMHADQIVVLDEGTICGLGTHRELLETCETYKEIVYSQLSAEEAA
jgi:ATP-binding cassette subfamily B multidrug efflux pump